MLRLQCPLCGDKNNAIEQPKNNKTGIFCPKCGLAYNYNLPIISIDNHWENFNFNTKTQIYDKEREVYFNHLWKYICHLTNKESGCVLDVGCGPGIILKIATSYGWRAEGVEISPVLCNYAKQNSQCTVFQGPVEKINFPEKIKYDIILMVDTFRHLVNPQETIKSCFGLLEDGGYLIIRDLNIDHSHSLKRFKQGLKYDLQFLSPKTAKEFLEKAKIINVKFYPSPMSLLTIPLIKRLDPKLRNLLMIFFNKFIQCLNIISFKKWLRLTPEMLILGKK